jgi:hypothetical protein
MLFFRVKKGNCSHVTLNCCRMLLKKLNSVAIVLKRTIPTERPRLLAKLVSTFADRGCRVVSTTDPHGRNLGFLDPEPLLFHSSSSSVILARLSKPRSQKNW